jgi:transcriptional regulator with XRE-family HTH domain
MPISSPEHADHPDLIALGAAIRQARLERAIPQEDLAHLSAVDRSYMSGIERGKQRPGIVWVLRIANSLGITAGELMGRAGL